MTGFLWFAFLVSAASAATKNLAGECAPETTCEVQQQEQKLLLQKTAETSELHDNAAQAAKKKLEEHAAAQTLKGTFKASQSCEEQPNPGGYVYCSRYDKVPVTKQPSAEACQAQCDGCYAVTYYAGNKQKAYHQKCYVFQKREDCGEWIYYTDKKGYGASTYVCQETWRSREANTSKFAGGCCRFDNYKAQLRDPKELREPHEFHTKPFDAEGCRRLCDEDSTCVAADLTNVVCSIWCKEKCGVGGSVTNCLDSDGECTNLVADGVEKKWITSCTGDCHTFTGEGVNFQTECNEDVPSNPRSRNFGFTHFWYHWSPTCYWKKPLEYKTMRFMRHVTVLARQHEDDCDFGCDATYYTGDLVDLPGKSMEECVAACAEHGDCFGANINSQHRCYLFFHKKVKDFDFRDGSPGWYFQKH